MHRYPDRATARPLAQLRPAKVIALEARREARRQADSYRPPPPRAA